MPQQPMQTPAYQPPGYMTAGGTFGMSQQQPVHGFVFVTGIDGAKAYQMPPNSEMPLFDSTNNGDIMFIKTTDGAGFPTIKVCNVTEIRDAQEATTAEYATHDELQKVYSDLSGQIEQMRGAFYGTVSQTAGAAEQPAGTNAKHSPNDGR